MVHFALWDDPDVLWDDPRYSWDGEPFALPIGRLHIGKFINTEPQYTINNEILAQEHIEEGNVTPNIVAVDGEDDSWTEYDRGDLTARDVAINEYLDQPELSTLGSVRQRAIEEIASIKRGSSPGGDVVWMPYYTRMDRVYWIGEDGSKYEARIEGLSVQTDQSMTPFQRATIDAGLAVLCLPDEVATYLVRDLFERESATGIGIADIGGSWVTYG